ncbi:MAG TPA: alcohol dehydrogenase catalytic domain-containing protein [Nitrososphaeraceae archaeon]|jgi:L-iditol 2-dehydrogenase
MHAAVFYGPGNIIVSHEASDYEKGVVKGRRGVLLRVKACAVCGYDVRVYRNGHQKVTPPVILGHEICGQIESDIVVATSDNGGEKERSLTVKSGTRVAVSPIIPCLNCIYCHYKQYNLCLNLKEIGSSINGGFAEFLRIPEETLKIGGLVSVPDSMSDEEVALLEPLACCLNGLSNMGPIVRKNERNRVAIIGDGPIGLLHLQLIKRLDGAKAMVIGRIPQRIQKAKTMGADATALFATNKNHNDINKIRENVLDFTCGIGFNTIIVATSNLAALDFATKIASKNSRINIFAGIPKSSDRSLGSFSLDPNLLHYNQISITGSFSSTPNMLREAARLASNNEIDLSKIISHRYPLRDINEAMLATERYRGLRVIINKF